MSQNELATVYAALILADSGLDISAENITAVTKSVGLKVDGIWSKVFAQALAGLDVNGLLSKIGAGAGSAPAAGGAAAPAAGGAAAPAAAVVEEEEEEEDEDMGFGLFD
ncbi:60s acidic ribosomal protein-domain-containing protein [Blastocladiella britannica]|nr:60s acidic ribosomal protein-domain-containing protein [Blastocladiella britannica]